METEATKELRAIKDAIAAKYKSFREFFDALIEAPLSHFFELMHARPSSRGRFGAGAR